MPRSAPQPPQSALASNATGVCGVESGLGVVGVDHGAALGRTEAHVERVHAGLLELEADGIVTRSEKMEGNVRVVDYTLTEAGRFLVPAILYLRDWRAVFGEFPKSTLTRTQGSWNDKRITYACEASDGSGLAVQIAFAYDLTGGYAVMLAAFVAFLVAADALVVWSYQRKAAAA